MTLDDLKYVPFYRMTKQEQEQWQHVDLYDEQTHRRDNRSGLEFQLEASESGAS